MSKAPVSLKQLAESKAEGIQKATYFKVHPDTVEFEEGFNLREEGPELDAHLESLYQAMKAGAYIPPIDVSVVDGRIVARDGHCRTRVAKRLIAEGVEYMLEARQLRGNDADCVLHMLGSDKGKKFSPLEQGRGFLRLVRYGFSIQKIADNLGLHRTTVDAGITLAEAPVDVQRLIADGTVSVQVALDAIKAHGSKAAEHLQKVVEKVQATGQKKVTAKHVSGPRVPKKVVQSFVTTTTALRKAVMDDLQFVENATDFDPETSKVEVPVKLLRDLLDAQAQCEVSDEDL